MCQINGLDKGLLLDVRNINDYDWIVSQRMMIG